jgi:hypothetical protein
MDQKERLLTAIVVLNIIAVLLLLHNSVAVSEKPAEKAIKFQSLVGGFGLGASVNPRWGFNNFDPRVERIEETNLYPIPGGYIYSPDRGLTVSDFSETN